MNIRKAKNFNKGFIGSFFPIVWLNWQYQSGSEPQLPLRLNPITVRYRSCYNISKTDSTQLSRHVSLQIGISTPNLSKFDKGVLAENATWVEFLRGAKVCAPGEGVAVTDGLSESVHPPPPTTHIVALYLKNCRMIFLGGKISLAGESFRASSDQMVREALLLLTSHLFKGKKNSKEGTLDFC